MEDIKISNFAPVIIPTLCRYEHFKRCVESLARCTHADKTDLFIGLDYPPSEKYVEGWKKISDYVDSIQGFHKVVIFRRTENFGAVKNSTDLRETVFKEYDSVIATEDDNEFSPNFLDYINKGLERFKDDDSVLAITGYCYPVNLSFYEKNCFLSPHFSAWGYGNWKRKERVYSSISRKDYFKSHYLKIISLIGHNRFHLFSHVIICLVKNIYHGDTFREFYSYCEKKYTLFPKISMVRNWGNDGSGLHCGQMKKHNVYEMQIIDRENEFYIPDIVDRDVKKNESAFNKFKRIRFVKKITVLFLMLAYFISQRFSEKLYKTIMSVWKTSFAKLGNESTSNKFNI